MVVLGNKFGNSIGNWTTWKTTTLALYICFEISRSCPMEIKGNKSLKILCWVEPHFGAVVAGAFRW